MNVLVTGGNTGMGYETALALAQLGHGVAITSRKLAVAEDAGRRIAAAVPGADIAPYQLDLNSFESITGFSAAVHQELDALDVAIFNAGVMRPPYAQTRDGFESQFQANYLGHFYLFQLLLDLILKSETRKVISISSSSSEKGTCDSIAQYENIARVTEAAYDAMKSYRESKLAQVLFTVEAARRCATEGVWSYAVHPGVVNTDLFYRNNSDLYKRVMQPLARLGYRTGRIKTPAQGAETAIYLATADVPENGAYWADKRVHLMNPIAQNAAFAAEFWDWSTSLTPVQR